jgi:DNA-binding NtrC family response regulator
MMQSACILVVDDNPDLLNTFALILKRKGYLVETAGDGLQAMDKFSSRHFDVVLMDVVMPNMNGVETLKKMREIDSGARVILMTAYCDEEQLREIARGGAYNALYKPVDIGHLMQLIGEITRDPAILVVDDDGDFRYSLSRMLELHNYQVVTAANGREALEIARKRNISLAFVDVKMSVMNGLTTSLKLKEISPGTLIVMMTGYRDEVVSIVSEAMGKGVVKCLYKPFDMAELKELVSRVSK